MLVNQKIPQRQPLAQNTGGKGNSRHTGDTRSQNQSSESQSKSGNGNLFDNSAGHQSNTGSGGMPFNNPMDDADTLMRAILESMPAKTEKGAKKNGSSPTEQKALAKVTEQFQSRFADTASNKEAFHELMQKSFGNQYDQGKAEEIRQQTLDGDFSWMPDIKLVDAATLTNTSGAQAGAVGSGAYSKEEDTIFLSRELLSSDPGKAEQVLAEEVGHALDARINDKDAAGDEGNIFSRLLHGDEISNAELSDLRSENDSGTIMVEGREVEVEFFIKKAWKKAKKAVKKVGKAIKKGVKKVGNAIKKGVKKVGKAIKKGIDKVKDVVKDHFEVKL